MADDFDNSDEIRNLSDDELKRYILDEFRAQKAFDVDDVEVWVNDGFVRLNGRVGTEEELRIIDHVMSDVIAIPNFDNQIVIDEIRRATSPEAIDEHLADDAPDSVGTHDIQEAIETAEPWIPPESPTPEGAAGQEDGRFGMDSQH
jgi:hypothetical protein